MYFSCKGNSWDADLVDMPLLSNFNKGVRFWLCVRDGFSKFF